MKIELGSFMPCQGKNEHNPTLNETFVALAVIFLLFISGGRIV